MSYNDDIDLYGFLRHFFINLKKIPDNKDEMENFDAYKELYNIRSEIEKVFTEQFQDLGSIPEYLIKKYETPNGKKIIELGPVVYGYCMSIGPNGKPKIREFGNVKFSNRKITETYPSSEREPLFEVSSTDKEVRIIAEIPGVNKEKIRIALYDKYIEIHSEDPAKKYYETIQIMEDGNIESGKWSYNNEILEILLKKAKNNTKLKTNK